jgi:hypothetical protein
MLVLSVRHIMRRSICKVVSLSSSQDKTNMHDWVTLPVREECMYTVKTLCAGIVKTYIEGRIYRSIDCVLVRIEPILQFESLYSCKSWVYMQGCVTCVIKWIQHPLQVESQCSYVAQPAS